MNRKSAPQEGQILDLLSETLRCVNVKSDDGQTESMFGYLIAPQLMLTAWSRLFPDFLRWTHDNSIIIMPSVIGFALTGHPDSLGVSAKLIAANSQADCALLKLSTTLPHDSGFGLGAFADPDGLEEVLCYLRTSDDTSPLGVPCTGVLRRFWIQGLAALPMHLLLVDHPPIPAGSTGGILYRGSPVISVRTKRCLGHISHPRNLPHYYWVCPASTASALNPFYLRYDYNPERETGTLDALMWIASTCRISVLTTRLADKDDVHVAMSLLGIGPSSPLAVEVSLLCQDKNGESRSAPILPVGTNIAVLLLDESVIEQGHYLRLEQELGKKTGAPILLACVVADQIGPGTERALRRCKLHLSVDRPLRWIFDRSRRIAAWVQILDRIRLILVRAVTPISAELNS